MSQKQDWHGGVRRFANCAELAAAFESNEGHYFAGHPDVKKLEAKLTKRFGMPTITNTRGMSAIMSVIHAFGPSVACSKDVYPGTKMELGELNINRHLQTLCFFDPTILKTLEVIIRNIHPYVVFIETIGNVPHMPIVDIETLLNIISPQKNCMLIVDTTATPFCKLPTHDRLIVVGSLTKYDQPDDEFTGGRISAPQYLTDKIYSTRCYKDAAMSPVTAKHFLSHLDDTQDRFNTHCDNAINTALICEKHPTVSQTWHPTLLNHPTNKPPPNNSCGFLYIQLKGGEQAALQMCNELAANKQRNWEIAPSFGSRNWRLFPFVGSLAKQVGKEGIVRIAPGRLTPHLNTTSLKKTLDNLS